MRGDQPVQINWTKNGVDVGNRNENTYTILRATFNHTGWYVCTAVNLGGKTHAEFWIDVTAGKAYNVLCDPSDHVTIPHTGQPTIITQCI